MLPVETDDSNRKVIDGYALAKFAQAQAAPMPDPSQVDRSARNRFVGLVTDIVVDKVMAQVELQCGPYRVVSLMSSEAVRELGLELGSVAVAVVKSTTVIIETPKETHETRPRRAAAAAGLVAAGCGRLRHDPRRPRVSPLQRPRPRP